MSSHQRLSPEPFARRSVYFTHVEYATPHCDISMSAATARVFVEVAARNLSNVRSFASSVRIFCGHPIPVIQLANEQVSSTFLINTGECRIAWKMMSQKSHLV